MLDFLGTITIDEEALAPDAGEAIDAKTETDDAQVGTDEDSKEADEDGNTTEADEGENIKEATVKDLLPVKVDEVGLALAVLSAHARSSPGKVPPRGAQRSKVG